MHRKLLLVAALVVGTLAPGLALAQNTPFLTDRGTLNLPFRGPATAGGSARLNNTIIGDVTPAAATVTTLRTTGTATSTQGAPAAKTVSATLTAAEVLTGIITVNQGAGAASALQLPAASAMDTALPTSVAGDAIDFSVINISTVAAEDASITTNTGWTLVGNIDIASNAAATDKSAGRFRARKTGTGAWVLYRIS